MMQLQCLASLIKCKGVLGLYESLHSCYTIKIGLLCFILKSTFNIDVCNVEYIYFLLSGSRLNINMNDIQKSLGG